MEMFYDMLPLSRSGGYPTHGIRPGFAKVEDHYVRGLEYYICHIKGRN
jgi:hypothetical protein